MRASPEVTPTNTARTMSKTPAIRAARSSVREGSALDRKHQRTTAAESSSIALSPPKARSAGLCAIQDATRETSASTLIHQIVNIWRRSTRLEKACAEEDAVSDIFRIVLFFANRCRRWFDVCVRCLEVARVLRTPRDSPHPCVNFQPRCQRTATGAACLTDSKRKNRIAVRAANS